MEDFISVYVTRTVTTVTEHCIEVPRDMDYEDGDVVYKYGIKSSQFESPLTGSEISEQIEISSIDEG